MFLRPWNPAALSIAILLVTAVASPLSARGFAASNWTLPTPDGNEVTLHDALADGPVVVSFWATWCIPCLKEMPALNELAAEFAGRATFIAISVDNSKSMAKVGPLVRAKGWDNVVVALDAAGTVQQMLQVLSPPYVVVYDTHGVEVYRHEGYKKGDELELKEALEHVFESPVIDRTAGAAPGGLDWSDAVSATNQFDYSYDTGTDKEISENWLDVAYQFGDFRTGVMLNHQSPDENGSRRTQVVHRYFEFGRGAFDFRVGHFYGMFGRGLVWNSYEDRFIRIDTSLDGLHTRGKLGPVNLQAFSGTTGTSPTFNDDTLPRVDVRGLDLESRPVSGLELGVSTLTYIPDLQGNDDGEVLREWVTAGRAGYTHPHASLYLEYARKSGYDTSLNTLDKDKGLAFYGNLGLYAGPVSLSIERSDYDKFKVLDLADGKQPLNRPPALVREHIYTLLGRKPHNMNQGNEKGWQIEANADLGNGWTALANASTIETHNRETLYEEVYGHLEQEHLGDWCFRGGFGYQDSKEIIRQTVVGDATWYMSDAMTWTVQAEHQHVRQGVFGEYDQQWYKLELELPPKWTIDAILETNNKFDAQFESDEIKGDNFPSAQIAYTLDGGGNLNLWFGKRQAGKLCAGGVCKFEPAFEGVELYGVFRY